MIKVHLPRYTTVLYYGERYLINFEYWTTAKNLEVAMKNLKAKVAQCEFFTKSVKEWKYITIHKEDLEIIEI